MQFSFSVLNWLSNLQDPLLTFSTCYKFPKGIVAANPAGQLSLLLILDK